MQNAIILKICFFSSAPHHRSVFPLDTQYFLVLYSIHYSVVQICAYLVLRCFFIGLAAYWLAKKLFTNDSTATNDDDATFQVKSSSTRGCDMEKTDCVLKLRVGYIWFHKRWVDELYDVDWPKISFVTICPLLRCTLGTFYDSDYKS